MKNKRRYSLCLKLASIFDSKYRYDIVHDAYLYYLDKRGESIFDIELRNETRYLYTVIKRAFYRWYYHERRGPKYIYSNLERLQTEPDKAYFSLQCSTQGQSTDIHNIMMKCHPIQHDILVASDNYQHIRSKYKHIPRLLPILDLKAQGYSDSDVGRLLGVSKQVVKYYTDKI